VADAYHPPSGAPYKISRAFDDEWGYRTRSMLVVPMRDHQNKVIGVVQLINKKRDPKAVLRPVTLVEEMVVPFTSVDEELVTSLASQAAVAFENARLIQDIKDLFDSFVRAAVKAIEQRDPTTSGHSERVATLTVGLAERVDLLENGAFRDVRFSRDQLQEIRYASLLHDFGKVGVREKVLIKGKKLYVGEMHLIRQRFAFIKRTLEAEHMRAKLEQVLGGRGAPQLLAEMDTAHESRQREIDQIVRMLLQANEPTILEEESLRALIDLPNRTFADMDGNRQPFLTPNEFQALSIRRGSLSEKERREIESHVTHTPREDGRHRLSPQARRGRHPDPVAHDDHLGHLRRAGGLGPPLQEIGAGQARARHPGRRSETGQAGPRAAGRVRGRQGLRADAADGGGAGRAGALDDEGPVGRPSDTAVDPKERVLSTRTGFANPATGRRPSRPR
jgi:hypothetical protein